MTSRLRSCRAAGRGLARVAAGLAAVGALLLALPVPAAIADQELGVRLGSSFGADADDAVPVVGIYSRWDIPGPVNLELSADYRQESLLGGDLEATVIPVRAAVVLNLLPVVSPYLLAGVGIDYVGLGFRNELSGSSDRTSAVFEVHAGGGLTLSLGPLSLSGDLRYSWAESVSGEAVQAALGHDYDPSGLTATLSAGIAF